MSVAAFRRDGILYLDCIYVGSCPHCRKMQGEHPAPDSVWDEKHKCHVGAGCDACDQKGIVEFKMAVPVTEDALALLEDEPDSANADVCYG